MSAATLVVLYRRGCLRRVSTTATSRFRFLLVETESWRPVQIASWAVEGNTPNASICVGEGKGLDQRFSHF